MDALSSDTLMLIRPDAAFEESYLEGFSEISVASEQRAWAYLPEGMPPESIVTDFPAYVAGLLAREHHPPEGFVRDMVYWGVADGQIIGRIAVRLELNDFLATLGGHIGYIVRPSQRNRGRATEMLRQALLTSAAKSIGKLLITCDETNLASEKVILRNGGIFENVLEAGPDKPRKKRFWIDLGILNEREAAE